MSNPCRCYRPCRCCRPRRRAAVVPPTSLCPAIPLATFLAGNDYPIIPGQVQVEFHFESGDGGLGLPNPTLIQTDEDLEGFLNDLVIPAILTLPGTAVEGTYAIANGQVQPPRVTFDRSGTTCSSSLLLVGPCPAQSLSAFLGGFSYPIAPSTVQLLVNGLGVIAETFNIDAINNDGDLLAYLGGCQSSMVAQGYAVVGNYSIPSPGFLVTPRVGTPPMCGQALVAYQPPPPPPPPPPPVP